MMEFTSVREHQDIEELAITTEFQVEMTGGAALQHNDIMKKTIFRLKDRHYAQILDYLETDDHFAEIWGSGRKTKVGGKNQSKAIAFGHMAVELRQLGWAMLSGATIGKKVKRYVETYRKSVVFYKSMGSGVTKKERQAGITMEAKMNTRCPYFFRMHALFGSCLNVDPPALCMLGVPADDKILILDSQVDISMEAVIETRPIDNSILEDEIHEVEDAASGEENESELSGSAPEETPIAFRSEVSPNFNKREIIEALVQTTPLANDPAKIASSNSTGKNVETSRARPNVEWHNRGLMAILFQNAQKQKLNLKLLCRLRMKSIGFVCWNSGRLLGRRK
ncbi:hypothetical protein R1flu_026282 [Riccia fluitans]|uniref:Uncharacterized protein n=1 Tax=Riccia fluitans TaxID=41844 RepID=A0ABD1XG36_9MARC